MKFDLRKTKASTVVDEMDQDDIFLYDDKKSSIPGFLENIEIDSKKIIGFFIRLALCGVGTLILIRYEKNNMAKLAMQRTMANTELSKLKSQKDNVKKEVDGFGHMLKKSEEFDNKLEVMQTIVDNRLSALTGLDHIQNAIPEEVWLRRVRFENNRFTLTGLSINTTQIQNFMKELEKTNLFSQVNLEKAGEDASSKSNKRRYFTILSVLKHKQK